MSKKLSALGLAALLAAAVQAKDLAPSYVYSRPNIKIEDIQLNTHYSQGNIFNFQPNPKELVYDVLKNEFGKYIFNRFYMPKGFSGMLDFYKDMKKINALKNNPLVKLATGKELDLGKGFFLKKEGLGLVGNLGKDIQVKYDFDLKKLTGNLKGLDVFLENGNFGIGKSWQYRF